MKSRLFLFLALILIILISCTKFSNKIRVGYLEIANSLPLYTAMENNLFRENGIEVELLKFTNSNDLIEALLSNRIDVEISASTAVLYSIETRKSKQFKIFSTNIQSTSKYPDFIIVNKNFKGNSLSDLKNKKIGTFPGSTFMIITKLIFKDFLNLEDLTIESIPPMAQIEALASNKVDAIFTLEPFATLALINANGRILEYAPSEKYVIDPLPGGVASFSTYFEKNNPKLAKKFVDSFDKSIDLIRSNESKARNYLTIYTPISEDLSKKIHLVEYWKSNEINTEILQKYADILYNEGGLVSKVNAENMIYERK